MVHRRGNCPVSSLYQQARMLNPRDGFSCSCAGLVAHRFSREGDEEKPFRGSWRGLFTGNKAERIERGREVIGHERFSCLFPVFFQ